MTYIGYTSLGNNTTNIALPAGTLVNDLMIVMIRAGAGFGTHTADLTDSRIVSQTTVTLPFGSAWPELHTIGWGYATDLSDVLMHCNSADGTSGVLVAVYRNSMAVTSTYSNGDAVAGTPPPLVPTLSPGDVNIVAVTAAATGNVYTDTAVWVKDASGGAESTIYSSIAPVTAGSLHVYTGASGEITIWSALSLSFSDAFWRNLVTNPSGEQSFDRAWTASNGAVATKVEWTV